MSQVNGEKTPADFVCFGGDQLTEERSRNIQKARADGRNVDEKLDGVWCKNEDWHGIRIAYQVCSFVVGWGWGQICFQTLPSIQRIFWTRQKKKKESK